MINWPDTGMNAEDYPGLFRGADLAAASAQRVYFGLQFSYLMSLVLSGLFTVVAYLSSDGVVAVARPLVAVLLVVGLILMWIRRARHDDTFWFDCRAVAESTKTAAWRFMMVAAPFEQDEGVSERFVSELHEIREARPDVHERLASINAAQEPPITSFMRAVRNSDLGCRKAFYVEHRLRDQHAWYTRKAGVNSQRGERCFWTIVTLQIGAVVLAIVGLQSESGVSVVVPLLITGAAAIAAWSQMKRHDELKTAYALAAQELGELNSIADSLTDDADFPQLVEQVEEAVSREHTMWWARRDVRLRGPRHSRRPQTSG